MPTYEYKCHRCGKTFEVRRRISEEPLKTHPDCGGEVEQVISAPALVFKGTGWYVTDYAKNGTSPAPTGSNGNSETKSETKGETPAPKTETKTESKSEPSPTSK
jgi:putative FmdB family regulatory protein